MVSRGAVEKRARRIDLRAHLLDRQIVDCEGWPVGVVDEVEIELPEDNSSTTGRPRITAIITGRGLLNRLSGDIPRADVLDRLSISDVEDIDVVLTLNVRREGMRVNWPEEWVRDHVIGRIPGARR
ncbi:hypothetical protein GOEFS_110_00620 [Gordonia effusa NBRC 100432]|uniref:PRC-barrel domain-containing protein n=1 Tax=Gordonia effusa NBRC 100432 TaxID=1077974 RepID=H0R5I2_9ACTN|nr:hypothetical protein GOEFS_110_00620 [Gordonia effusa NBRC 100432]